jgi:4-hydroxy-tetrahydrodipicolinate synthase
MRKSRMANVLGEVLTAIVTPFDKDGAVDYDRFRALARHVIDSGADGLVVAATTGESPTLTDDEKLELWAASVEEVGERATVIASTGTYSTAHSVHLTEQAHELGVDGFLVVTPYYNKPPSRGIVEHFKAISAASDKPIIVYNIPQRVVVNIEPETMIQLAEIPTVKAVKQATEELDQAKRIVDETDLALYAGSDHLVYPFLEVGGVGGVVVYGNLVPGRVKEMIRLYSEGDTESARRIDDELKPLVDVLGVTINPIPVKAALNLLGHEVGGLRLPLVEASDEELIEIRSVLERVGLTAPARV